MGLMYLMVLWGGVPLRNAFTRPVDKMVLPTSVLAPNTVRMDEGNRGILRERSSLEHAIRVAKGVLRPLKKFTSMRASATGFFEDSAPSPAKRKPKGKIVQEIDVYLVDKSGEPVRRVYHMVVWGVK